MNTNKSKSLIVLLLIILTSLQHQAFASGKDSITIAGSTTILPISEIWAKRYRDKTGVIVNVHGGGSTGGIKATKLGTADIGASSRDLTDTEKDKLREVVIGRDALAIIVNKKNPIQNLTVKQARKIFAGEIKNWSELGGLDKKIQIVNRESGSGTRNTFEDVVMKIVKKDYSHTHKPMSLRAIVNNSNAEVKESVKMIPGGVGYVSVGFVDDSVKAIEVNSIEPTEKNIAIGKYPLVRNLYFLVKGSMEEVNGKVKRFIRYVLSNEGQSLVLREGFYPISSVN